MSQKKHTPGPWEVDEFTDLTATSGPKRISLTVAHLWSDEDGTHTDNVAEVVMDYAPGIAEANAQLLAAAPDILNACKTALSSLIEWGDGEGETAETLRSAIEKVEPPEPNPLPESDLEAMCSTDTERP